jgi:uncharacterized protein (DUF1697 family)
MIYVALLRGINVGGKNMIEMKRLKTLFEDAGMVSVRTYINSGNVIFSTRASDRSRLARKLETAITERLGLTVGLIVRDVDQIRAIADAIPRHWTNDEQNKCDVLFLWDEIDRPSVLQQLDIDPTFEEVRYVPGAVIRCVSRRNAPRSKLLKIVGTPIYPLMTIRNCNTARKLLELMES